MVDLNSLKELKKKQNERDVKMLSIGTEIPTTQDIINEQKAAAFDKICQIVQDNIELPKEFLDKITIITNNWKGDNPEWKNMLAKYDEDVYTVAEYDEDGIVQFREP